MCGTAVRVNVFYFTFRLSRIRNEVYFFCAPPEVSPKANPALQAQG